MKLPLFSRRVNLAQSVIPDEPTTHFARAARFAEVGQRARELNILDTPRQKQLVTNLVEVAQGPKTPEADIFTMGQVLAPLDISIVGHHGSLSEAARVMAELMDHPMQALATLEIGPGFRHFDAHMLGSVLKNHLGPSKEALFNVLHLTTVPSLYQDALTLLYRNRAQFQPEVTAMIEEAARQSSGLFWKASQQVEKEAAALLATVIQSRLVSGARKLFFR